MLLSVLRRSRGIQYRAEEICGRTCGKDTHRICDSRGTTLEKYEQEKHQLQEQLNALGNRSEMVDRVVKELHEDAFVLMKKIKYTSLEKEE